jgi:hypothetical protein
LSKKLIRALVDTAHALTAIQSLIRFVQKSLVSSKNFELNKLPDGDYVIFGGDLESFGALVKKKK